VPADDQPLTAVVRRTTHRRFLRRTVGRTAAPPHRRTAAPPHRRTARRLPLAVFVPPRAVLCCMLQVRDEVLCLRASVSRKALADHGLDNYISGIAKALRA
jgi:hypothetical protein